MRISAAKDRAHPGSGISDAYWTDRFDQLNGERRAVIYAHPMVSSTAAIINNIAGAYYGQKALNEEIGNAGYLDAASDLGYFTTQGWGNPAEQTRIGELATWAKAGAGGSSIKPLVAVGISAGVMGLINYYGQAGDPRDVAAFVLILPPYDLDNIYENNLGGGRAAAGLAWSVTYPTPLPPNASPKENAPALAGSVGRIYFASDDPLNGPAVVEDMLDTLGQNWSSINLGPLGHTEVAINAIDRTELIGWLKEVAPPI